MRIINKIVWIIIFVVIDFALWIVIGLVLLNYEDNWDSSKGYYFSLGGMTWLERIAYISYFAWIVINVFFMIYLILKIIKKYIIKTNAL